MSNQKRILRHPGLDPLWAGIRREERQQQIAAVVLLTLGIATMIILGRTPWAALGGLGLTVAALIWIYRLSSARTEAALRQQLQNEPESIVWVYGTLTRRSPFGLNIMQSATLHLVETDGIVQEYSIKPARLKLVSKTLNRVLPHAQFGYTEERAARYTPKRLPNDAMGSRNPHL